MRPPTAATLTLFQKGWRRNSIFSHSHILAQVMLEILFIVITLAS